MVETTDIHTSAKQLVIKAAEQSGLLQEVAEFLWFTSRLKMDDGRCLACELVDELAEAFDDHIVLPHVFAERVFGEGLCILPKPDEAAEVAAFIG